MLLKLLPRLDRPELVVLEGEHLTGRRDGPVQSVGQRPAPRAALQDAHAGAQPELRNNGGDVRDVQNLGAVRKNQRPQLAARPQDIHESLLAAPRLLAAASSALRVLFRELLRAHDPSVVHRVDPVVELEDAIPVLHPAASRHPMGLHPVVPLVHYDEVPVPNQAVLSRSGAGGGRLVAPPRDRRSRRSRSGIRVPFLLDEVLDHLRRRVMLVIVVLIGCLRVGRQVPLRHSRNWTSFFLRLGRHRKDVLGLALLASRRRCGLLRRLDHHLMLLCIFIIFF
mmetsp:Transcript_8620/g.29600  ORF Transcript_8620/g.29600 Transcript_8620/m.29600 type:complete len:281 (-) Transcript_8620:96-938(-)